MNCRGRQNMSVFYVEIKLGGTHSDVSKADFS